MPEYLKLEEFGSQIWAAFGEPPYLVGSALKGKVWRDVDVRLMLDDEQYEKMGFGDPRYPHSNARWIAYTLAFSALGKAMTGLPIDFQIQQTSLANSQEARNPRSCIGMIPLRMQKRSNSMCEELEEKLYEGAELAEKIVEHLLNCGRDSGTFRVSARGRDFRLRVLPAEDWTSIEDMQKELQKTRELLAGAYRKESGKIEHTPECGVNKAPAQCPEPCSCGPKLVPVQDWPESEHHQPEEPPVQEQTRMPEPFPLDRTVDMPGQELGSAEPQKTQHNTPYPL